MDEIARHKRAAPRIRFEGIAPRLPGLAQRQRGSAPPFVDMTWLSAERNLASLFAQHCTTGIPDEPPNR
ncbi:beta-lactamase [Rhodovulum sulfidophilum]|uniref:Beta-lactamase n=1 Tax=Rhodovulum sulfidophilum TaxID=35806 RepID=A0A0D6AZJ4_RHOSU|nr:beta-lactamase [Rhodovulum sulfidophilum]